MFEMSVIIVCVITLIIFKLFLNINFKEIKKLNIRTSQELEVLSDRFPSDEQMCKEMLEKFNKQDVKVKVDSEYNSCLYTVFNNTITIGKFKQDYMKPQTIAHECIHSGQNKITLCERSSYAFLSYGRVMYDCFLCTRDESFTKMVKM